MRSARLIPTLAAAGVCLATLGVTVADASAPLAKPKPPAGYRVVISPQLPSPNGSESRGIVSCPTGTVPLGGGAIAQSPSIRANVSSSFPSGRTWVGDVKNGSGTATTFQVEVICAKRPKGYRQVESRIVSNPAGTQSKAVATCPSGTMPLGGGGFTSSEGTDANMNGTAPKGRTWVVRENNEGTTDATIGAVAVCGKLHGYRVVKGKPFSVIHGLEAGSFASCPAPTVPISGGVFSGSKSVFVNFAGSFPTGHEWDAFVNNSTEGDISSSAVVVCASQ